MDFNVSNYNFDGKAREGMRLPQCARVFDTTLRDGEQTPGVCFSDAEKFSIAGKLSEMGVDTIEAGFPANSSGEKAVVKEIAGMGLRSEVCGLARVVPQDIEACVDCGVGIVHVFISTSDLHVRHQMNSSREAVLKKAVDGVRSVKDRGLRCMFSPMDATRTDFGYLQQVCSAVQEERVDVINIPDTVGVMNPAAMRALVARLREFISIPLDVHCHNDFGLAVANSLAAIEAGADGVQVTVNGLGERAGNASLEQAVMSLHALYGVSTRVNSRMFAEVSGLVEKFSMVRLTPNWPLVGRNSFTHESGIHAAAVLRHADTFEPLSPGVVGMRSRIVLGKHTGRHAVESALAELGFCLNEAQLVDATARIKQLSSRQKKLAEEDVVAVANDVLGSHACISECIRVEGLSVSTGNQAAPVASVALRVNGERRVAVASGVGAIDAAVNAVRSAVPFQFELRDYSCNAASAGTDAVANASVVLVDGDKVEHRGEASHEDVVFASVNAIVRGMNKALARKREPLAGAPEAKLARCGLNGFSQSY